MRTLSIFLFFLFIQLSHAAPEPFNATYQVSRNGFHLGESQRTLVKQDDGTYVFSASTQPVGIASLFVSMEVN